MTDCNYYELEQRDELRYYKPTWNDLMDHVYWVLQDFPKRLPNLRYRLEEVQGNNSDLLYQDDYGERYDHTVPVYVPQGILDACEELCDLIRLPRPFPSFAEWAEIEFVLRYLVDEPLE